MSLRDPAVPDVPATDGTTNDWRRSAAFFAVLIAFVLEVADSTIVNTALPQIRAAIGGGAAAMQWIAAAYFLTLGSLLMLGGRLGDLFGYRRVFLVGIAAFVVASGLCGLARTAEELVAARLVQGAAGALMAPQVMAIVQVLFTPLERVGRLAWFGVVGGIAAILGPIVSGLLIEADFAGLGWRAIFLINLPVGLLALLAVREFVPTIPPAGGRGIDWTGTVFLVLGFAAVLLGLIEGPALGWPTWTAASLTAGAAGLWWGWMRAKSRAKADRPAVLAPNLFGLMTFAWGIATTTVFSAASAGFLLVFAISLQQGLGLTALDTALRHIPFGIGVMAGISLIGRRYLPRFGKWLIVGGAATTALFGALSLHLIAASGGPVAILSTTLLFAGIGMGMVMGPLPPVIVADVARPQAGSASATMRTAQQLGGALGVAIVGAAYLAIGNGDTGARLSGLYPAMGAYIALLALAISSALRLPRDIFGIKGEPDVPRN